MVLGTLKQLEALVESLGILIGHCHGIKRYTKQIQEDGI